MATTVFRVEKNREYVVMNNQFLRNKEMSLKAKGLLAMCLALPDSWEYSINGLVAICKESQTAIRSTLKELEKFGHLQRNRKKDDKGQFYYEYVLYEIPYEGFEHAGKRNTQKQKTEKQSTENNIQISNKKEKIKKESIKEKNIYNIENYRDILDTIGDLQLRELYIDFLENRAYMGDPLTKTGLELLRVRVRELVGLDTTKQKRLLQTAIINNWKNVYLKEEPEEDEVYSKLKDFYS